jgi:hypothetical protein
MDMRSYLLYRPYQPRHQPCRLGFLAGRRRGKRGGRGRTRIAEGHVDHNGISHLHTPYRWGSMMLSDSKDEAGIGVVPQHWM